MKVKKSTQISRVFFFIFLLSYPLSVSISQISFILSCLFFFWNLGQSRKKVDFGDFFPGPFWVAIGIYVTVFFNTILLEIIASGFDGRILTGRYWIEFSRGETSDFWMTFGIPLGIYHWNQFRNKDRLIFILCLGILLCILSGLVSIFTPYRLARFIQLGFEYPEGERLQHYAGTILGIGTYLPIGLQATHLTYGGILGMSYPGLICFLFFLRHKFYHTVSSLFRSETLIIPKVLFWLSYPLIVGTGGFVLLTNQSRSVLLGILLVASFLVIGLVFQKKVYGNRVLRIFSFLLILGIGLGFLGKKIYDSNWLFQRAITDLTQKVSTENQRYFILKNTFQILSNNWILGVGNNRFREHWIKESEEIILEREWIWYEMEITPKSHAHHDFLHFWTVGGILSAGLFSLLWILIWARFYYVISRFRKQEISIFRDSPAFLLTFGILILFPAGFFQCFLLDDEVTLPFYIFLGLFLAPIHGDNQFPKENSRQNFSFLVYGILTVGTLLGLSVGFWKYRTSIPIEEVHTKKKTLEVISDSVQVLHLEGCLSHRFKSASTEYPPRDKDYTIHLQFTKREQRYLVHPYKVVVRLMDRDSFDQDKLYKAHKSEPIAERVLNQGKNWERDITVRFPEGRVLSPSNGYSDAIRFRDFLLEFHFREGTQKPVLPTIKLGEMCGLREN